jgi:hypothetical protein
MQTIDRHTLLSCCLPSIGLLAARRRRRRKIVRVFVLLLHRDHFIVQAQIHVGTEFPPDKGLNETKKKMWQIP